MRLRSQLPLLHPLFLDGDGSAALVAAPQGTRQLVRDDVRVPVEPSVSLCVVASDVVITRSSDKPCAMHNELHRTIGVEGPDCGCSPTLWALLPQCGSTCPHEVHDARCMIHDVIQPAVLRSMVVVGVGVEEQGKNMARARQEHGKSMARTWQEHGTNMARALEMSDQMGHNFAWTVAIWGQASGRSPLVSPCCSRPNGLDAVEFRHIARSGPRTALLHRRAAPSRPPDGVGTWWEPRPWHHHPSGIYFAEELLKAKNVQDQHNNVASYLAGTHASGAMILVRDLSRSSCCSVHLALAV
jgi:hypothetical protein